MYGDSINITEQEVEYKANINEPIEKLNKIEPLTEQEVVENNITLVLKAPTFQDLYLIEKDLRGNKVTDEQVVNSSTTEVGDTLGDAFVGELSKYIKEIVITNEAGKSPIGYNHFNFVEKHKIIEQLPASLVKKALPFISESAKKLTEALQVTGVTTENINKTVNITIDASLFPVE